MKLASEESTSPNGPVSPIWRSLKGFSSRDTSQTSPLSPEASSLGTAAFSASGDSPIALELRKESTTHSARNSPINEGCGASTRVFIDSGDLAGPKYKDNPNLHPDINSVPLQNPPFGRSSSTLSTSLSNHNLAEQSKPMDGSRSLSPVTPQEALASHESKDDPQVFR